MSMAAATGSPEWLTGRSPSLSASRSPDTASPIYPERAIRPLPKSRLKAKLSPEQQSSIIFPPEPPPISPTLSFAGGADATPSGNRITNGHTVQEGPVGRLGGSGVAHGHYLHHQPHPQHEASVHHSHCTCGEEGDSGDEEVEFDHPDYRYAAPTANGTSVAKGKVLDNVQRRLMDAARVPTKPPPPGSTASSADGYESFENTSNKKKRKIPLSTATNIHQSQLNAEMASMGISGSVDGAGDDGGGGAVAVQQPYTPPAAVTASSGTGISGAGRGRYGRQNVRTDGHGIRRPLGSSSLNSVNGYAGGGSHRLSASRMAEVKGAADTGIENTNTGGIISQAIKSAAEQGPLTPQKPGQDSASASLLQSAATSTPANAKTQFTFTVESESANKMVDQQAAAAAAQAAYHTPGANGRGVNGQATQGGKGVNTQGTQTTPSLRGNAPPGNAPRQAPNAPPNQHPPPPGQQQAVPPKPKPRRRPSKEFALAARQRRLQQEYTNYHHRPTKDNMWICEFCEYEDIFGVPPVALIRQYEIKDRQDRKRQAEKRRLLEKARAKGKKGKKGSGKKGGGNSALNNAMPQQHASSAQNAAYDPNLPPPGDEEYFDDEEYGDEYDPVGPDDEVFDGTHEYYHPNPPPPVPQGLPQAPPGGGGGGRRSG